MSDDLPMGWDKAFLGDVCEIARGGSPRPIQKYLTDDPDGINWIKISDATESEKYIFKTKQKITRDGISNSRFVKDGDFILSNSMSFGRPYIVRTEGCIHDGWLVLSVNNEVFNPDYLYHFLGSQEAYSQFNSKAAGSTVRNLNIEIVKTVEAIVPPLNEQRRIVDKLDRIGDRNRTARNELNHIPKLIARYKQAVLAAAYTNLLERESILRTLGECSIEVRNGLSNKPSETQSDIKILRISAVRQGRVNNEDVRFYVPKVNEDITRYYLQKGDLLFTRYNGNTDYVAVCGMFMEEVENFVYPDKLIRVRVNPAIVIPEFIELIFQTPQVRETLRSYIKTSAGQHGISGGDLKSIIIPVPSIISQRIIVENTAQKLNFLRSILREHERAQSLLDRLEQATLAKAFRGELVPQDPDDEPASVLLEQVKREKEKGKKVRM